MTSSGKVTCRFSRTTVALIVGIAHPLRLDARPFTARQNRSLAHGIGDILEQLVRRRLDWGHSKPLELEQEVNAGHAGQLRRLARREFADRKSTRLNSSHLGISYASFCL